MEMRGGVAAFKQREGGSFELTSIFFQIWRHRGLTLIMISLHRDNFHTRFKARDRTFFRVEAAHMGTRQCFAVLIKARAGVNCNEKCSTLSEIPQSLFRQDLGALHS